MHPDRPSRTGFGLADLELTAKGIIRLPHSGETESSRPHDVRQGIKTSGNASVIEGFDSVGEPSDAAASFRTPRIYALSSHALSTSSASAQGTPSSTQVPIHRVTLQPVDMGCADGLTQGHMD